jgi:hypothetical protein
MRAMTTLVVLAAVLGAAGPAAAELNDTQRALMVEHFGKLKDLQDFSATAVDAALKDEEFKSFFDGYGKVITVVQIADKIASAKDTEAMQLVGGEAMKASLEYMAKKVPALGGAVGAVNFLGWVNTGLGLFKDFVFDPMLEKQQFEHYVKLRGALDPEDASAKVPGWGHIREKALKQLEKQGFNMELLWENGEKGKLSKAWEAKLEQFVTASFEARYTRKLVADAAKNANKELPALDKKAKKALAKHKDDSADAGNFAIEITQIQGKKVEFYVNGKLVAADLKNAKNIVLGKDNKVEVRAVAVGARRQQSRDFKTKKPGAVTLDGVPTDYAFAYSAGANSSSWATKDETYDWKIQSKFNKLTSQTKSNSRPAVKDDKVTLVVAGDLANETITMDVTGRVQWGMSGKRANGAAATDSSDESETGAIVIHVTPRK